VGSAEFNKYITLGVGQEGIARRRFGDLEGFGGLGGQ